MANIVYQVLGVNTFRIPALQLEKLELSQAKYIYHIPQELRFELV
jgi:hypothetical protein